MFVQIVIFFELPGSYHPTKQIFVILAQIVVFVVFFSFSLYNIHPIILHVIALRTFCNFCQNCCFRHFCHFGWGLGPSYALCYLFVILVKIVVFVVFVIFAAKLTSCHPSCNFTQQFLVIFVKIVAFVVFLIFWLSSLDPLMPRAIALNNF